MQYLVNTGIWLRLFDRDDPEHATIREALRLLRAEGDSLVVCPQNIAEFWNVSTRPSTARGGYGKSVETTERRVQFIERHALVLDETSRAYEHWRHLLVQYQIVGLAVHDSRLVSVIQVAHIGQVLTLNAGDFTRYMGIVALTPRAVVASASA
jgi:predicted nucleic acid-binding protein